MSEHDNGNINQNEEPTMSKTATANPVTDRPYGAISGSR